MLYTYQVQMNGDGSMQMTSGFLCDLVARGIHGVQETHEFRCQSACCKFVTAELPCTLLCCAGAVCHDGCPAVHVDGHLLPSRLHWILLWLS